MRQDIPSQQPSKEDLAPWTIKATELAIDENQKLGQGGFGIVYRGSFRHNTVAIKQLHVSDYTQEALKELQREAVVMGRLRSPQIIQFYGFCFEAPYRMVMEYAEGGSLAKVLHNSSIELSWTQRYQIALDATIGLHYLHEEQLIHRDLKSPNVLLDKHYRAKLADFGLAKAKNESSRQSKTDNLVGSLLWMAPELIMRKKATKASDVFALGVIFWELLTRRYPWEDENSALASVWVAQGQREAIPESCPESFKTLIEDCWAQEPKSRPTTDQIIQRLKPLLASSPEEKPTRLSAPAPNYVSNTASMSLDYVDNTLDTLSQPKREEKRESSAQQPRFFQPLDKKKKEAVLKLLTHVVRGEEAEAKAMIEKEAGLLLERGSVVDYSGRTIEGTAFQLALGAEDVEMAEMIVPYLDEEEKIRQYAAQFPPEEEKAEQERQQRDEAALQKVFKAIGASKDDQGCEQALVEFRNYLKPRGVIKTGKHFNTQLLLKTFELYDQHYEAFGAWESRKNRTAWRKVLGYIQRYLPACYAQAFCQGIYYIVEKGEKLQRSLEFQFNNGVKFYPLDSDSASRLGFDFVAGEAEGRWRWRQVGEAGPSVLLPRDPVARWLVARLTKIMSSKNRGRAQLMRGTNYPSNPEVMSSF